MKGFHVLAAAFAGFAALQVAATECGVKNTNLTKPFAGHWRSKDGESYDIKPGKVVHSGDRIKQSSPRFVTDYNGESPEEAALDCRDLSVAERDEIQGTITNLANVVALRNSERGGQKRQEVALFQSSLAKIPRPMLALTHYENWQWMVLLSPNRMLDVWYGQGEFSVKLFQR